jgi:MOSC domain-containing protein YiiM
VTGFVDAIYVAASAGADPQPLSVAVLKPARGIVGDRYYARAGTFSDKLKNSGDWEVTLIEREEIDRFLERENRVVEADAFRRNIVTVGVRLNDLVGRRFEIGTALLEGLRLCEPCAHLAKWHGPQIVSVMAHRAGLRARIVSGGEVRPGDKVVPQAVA